MGCVSCGQRSESVRAVKGGGWGRSPAVSSCAGSTASSWAVGLRPAGHAHDHRHMSSDLTLKWRRFRLREWRAGHGRQVEKSDSAAGANKEQAGSFAPASGLGFILAALSQPLLEATFARQSDCRFRVRINIEMKSKFSRSQSLFGETTVRRHGQHALLPDAQSCAGEDRTVVVHLARFSTPASASAPTGTPTAISAPPPRRAVIRGSTKSGAMPDLGTCPQAGPERQRCRNAWRASMSQRCQLEPADGILTGITAVG